MITRSWYQRLDHDSDEKQKRYAMQAQQLNKTSYLDSDPSTTTNFGKCEAILKIKLP